MKHLIDPQTGEVRHCEWCGYNPAVTELHYRELSADGTRMEDACRDTCETCAKGKAIEDDELY